MQSIIDKLQTPQSFLQSVQELVIALQRTGDPGKLTALRTHLDLLSSLDPNPGTHSNVYLLFVTYQFDSSTWFILYYIMNIVVF